MIRHERRLFLIRITPSEKEETATELGGDKRNPDNAKEIYSIII